MALAGSCLVTASPSRPRQKFFDRAPLLSAAGYQPHDEEHHAADHKQLDEFRDA
jgi:hypothetical protein